MNERPGAFSDSAILEGTFSEAVGQETLSTESLSDLENVLLVPASHVSSHVGTGLLRRAGPVEGPFLADFQEVSGGLCVVTQHEVLGGM